VQTVIIVPADRFLQNFILLVCSILILIIEGMNTTDLTFNDLPKVVGELCRRIAGMENLLRDTLNRQSEPKENLHVPMTVQEACAYLKMPVSTFYYKIKKDNIPVIKQGKHLYIYRDELDKWLEASRKTSVPLTYEEENEAMYTSHRRKPNPKNW
jgi:excisionase family DNA binding protein